jgi:hypothetical protein
METTCAPTVSTTDCTQARKHRSNAFGLIRSNTRRNVSGQGIPLFNFLSTRSYTNVSVGSRIR